MSIEEKDLERIGSIYIGKNMKTVEQVRSDFYRAGMSITEWAGIHGYPPYLVQQVLSGKARCLRGRSHEIAVLLELKDGFIAEKPN